MPTLKHVALTTVAIAAMFVGPTSTPVVAQEATPVETPVATPASPVATPVGESQVPQEITVDLTSPRFPVAGNAFGLLEPGTPGELSVVATGPIAGALEVPVIVRNNTDAPMISVTVRIEVRDANGTMLGQAARTGITPYVLDPGALGIVTIYSDQPMPDGGTVRYYPEGNSDPYFTRIYDGYSGVELTEFLAYPERLEGRVQNVADSDLTLENLHFACWDASGTLVSTFLSGVFQTLGPGESIRFEAQSVFTFAAPPCDFFLVTGSGQ